MSIVWRVFKRFDDGRIGLVYRPTEHYENFLGGCPIVVEGEETTDDERALLMYEPADFHPGGSDQKQVEFELEKFIEHLEEQDDEQDGRYYVLACPDDHFSGDPEGYPVVA